MSLKTLEARVTELEMQLAKLHSDRPRSPARDDWKKTVGMFAGDPLMAEIMQEALNYREADRRKTKPKRSARKVTK